jgi:hypothetical protein
MLISNVLVSLARVRPTRAVERTDTAKSAVPPLTARGIGSTRIQDGRASRGIFNNLFKCKPIERRVIPWSFGRRGEWKRPASAAHRRVESLNLYPPELEAWLCDVFAVRLIEKNL